MGDFDGKDGKNRTDEKRKKVSREDAKARREGDRGWWMKREMVYRKGAEVAKGARRD